MLDAETVVGSGTMKVVCSREELTQKLAVVSRGVSTLLETSNQTFHPGTGWATETMRPRRRTSTLIDGEIKSGNERAAMEPNGYIDGLRPPSVARNPPVPAVHHITVASTLRAPSHRAAGLS